MLTIKSQILQVSQSKGNMTSMFVVTTNSFMGIHRDNHGCPDPTSGKRVLCSGPLAPVVY
jgi:hypothetical protein